MATARRPGNGGFLLIRKQSNLHYYVVGRGGAEGDRFEVKRAKGGVQVSWGSGLAGFVGDLGSKDLGPFGPDGSPPQATGGQTLSSASASGRDLALAQVSEGPFNTRFPKRTAA
jgi:hypothetical protein